MSKASKERWHAKLQEGIAKRQLREYHYHKQGGFCAYCDIKMRYGDKTPRKESVTLEHIIPQSHGGRNVPQETIAICYECNQTRHNFPLSLDLLLRVFIYNGVDSIPAIMHNLEVAANQKFYELSVKYAKSLSTLFAVIR